jgi:hypothetical protein
MRSAWRSDSSQRGPRNLHPGQNRFESRTQGSDSDPTRSPSRVAVGLGGAVCDLGLARRSPSAPHQGTHAWPHAKHGDSTPDMGVRSPSFGLGSSRHVNGCGLRCTQPRSATAAAGWLAAGAAGARIATAHIGRRGESRWSRGHGTWAASPKERANVRPTPGLTTLRARSCPGPCIEAIRRRRSDSVRTSSARVAARAWLNNSTSVT